MQEVVALTSGESAFRDAPLVRIEVLPLVAVVGIGQSEFTPNATLRCGERYRIVVKQRHRPGIVLHRGRGEGGLADSLVFGPAFDTASNSLGGLMGGEDRVLTTEVGMFSHVVVGEGLYVALGVTVAPRHLRGDLATTLPRRNRLFEKVSLLVRHIETSDCCPTHVIVCHSFNGDMLLLIFGQSPRFECSSPSRNRSSTLSGPVIRSLGWTPRQYTREGNRMRMPGIEPGPVAWEATVLPLDHIRLRGLSFTRPMALVFERTPSLGKSVSDSPTPTSPPEPDTRPVPRIGACLFADGDRTPGYA